MELKFGHCDEHSFSKSQDRGIKKMHGPPGTVPVNGILGNKTMILRGPSIWNLRGQNNNYGVPKECLVPINKF